tara:strand:- start:25 stop:498 length:474 start_codon:yes stop_codon:yes gene_type:complete
MKESYLKRVNNSFLYRLFLLKKLPIAWISGLRVNKVDRETARVSLKHVYLNQNPFNSMYFACQAMAAEMSTGLLALGYLDEIPEKLSMLVLDFTSNYSKKAVGKIQFVCLDGLKVKASIQEAVITGKGVVCVMESKGFDAQGDCVSTFKISWSFKKK